MIVSTVIDRKAWASGHITRVVVLTGLWRGRGNAGVSQVTFRRHGAFKALSHASPAKSSPYTLFVDAHLESLSSRISWPGRSINQSIKPLQA